MAEVVITLLILAILSWAGTELWFEHKQYKEFRKVMRPQCQLTKFWPPRGQLPAKGEYFEVTEYGLKSLYNLKIEREVYPAPHHDGYVGKTTIALLEVHSITVF